MVQHVRETIVDAVKTQIERIGVDSTVTWAVDSSPGTKFRDGIRTRKLDQDGMSLASLPDCLLVPRTETTARDGAGGTSSRYGATMSLLIDIWFESFDMSEDASRVLHDVELIFGIDPQFGGVCRDSRITGNRTFISEDQQPLTGIQVTAEIDYGYFEDDPATLA